MWDLVLTVVSTVASTLSGSTAEAAGPAPASTASAPAPGVIARSPGPEGVEGVAPVAIGPAPVAISAAKYRTLLPKAAWRSIRRGSAELWREGDRLVVRPTAAWLSRIEERRGRLDVSEDAGRTWRVVELAPCGNAGCVLRLERGGALQMMTGVEASCGGGHQSRFVGHVDGREWLDAPWPWDSAMNFSLPADGWAAGRCRPADTLKAAWSGPEDVPCLVDLGGHEVYLPIEWNWNTDEPIQADPVAGEAEYRGRRFPLR